MREKARLARFVSYKADPKNASDLAADHPAVVDGRTLFPGTVVGTFESRRFLVSGHNSPKTGGMVEKGPWAGMPIFTLTLEERATCPRSCAMWRGCYGAGMPYARRNDAHDPDFIPALKAEVITLVRETCAPQRNKPNFKPPRGIVVRLHILGDFFSTAYVDAWRQIMETLPEVHVFGYTARRVDDESSWDIAAGIETLNRRFPDRWVIRTSHREPGPMRSIVVMDEASIDDVILCPAMTSKTEACSTCGLCWLPAAKAKTISFLRHGSVGGRRRKDDQTPVLHAKLLELADPNGLVVGGTLWLAGEADISQGAVLRGMRNLTHDRLLRMLRSGHRGAPSVWQVFAAAQAEFPLAPPLPLPSKKPKRHLPSLRDPPAKKDAVPVVPRKPDAPLMPVRPHAHRQGGWGQLQEGSAGPFDPEAAKARVESVSAEERARIAAQYLKEPK